MLLLFVYVVLEGVVEEEVADLEREKAGLGEHEAEDRQATVGQADEKASGELDAG